jgi:hypothetical protein
MSNLPNPGELVSAMQSAATAIVGKDISTVEGFAKDQLLRIEKLSIRLGEMIIAGEFDGDPDGQKDYLGIVQDLITNFTKTLQGLAIITIEKVWNALVNVVWTALDKATGLALPRPVP